MITLRNSNNRDHKHGVRSFEHFVNILMENNKPYRWYVEVIETKEKSEIDLRLPQFKRLFDGSKDREAIEAQLRNVFKPYASQYKAYASKQPKPRKEYICDKAHSKECAEMAKAKNNGVYDQKIYEAIAQANGWWIKNPNA